MGRRGWVWGVVAVLSSCAPIGGGGDRVTGAIVASRRLKPNVMLLVDNSGSMLLPVDPSASSCPAGCGPMSAPCPAGCATRSSELKRALSGVLLSAVGAEARFGLTVYPRDAVCGGPDAVEVALPEPREGDTGSEGALAQHAQAVSDRIERLAPIGGTPTGAALKFLATVPGLGDPADHRDDVVLLITDGLPNCNGANPVNACSCDPGVCGACPASDAPCGAQVAACRCTTSTCAGTLCALGCLDVDGTVEQIAALRATGVRTVVVGYGAEVTTPEAAAELGAMAVAGGMRRSCVSGSDAECGTSGTCDAPTRLCTVPHLLARDGGELTQVLTALFERPAVAGACELTLSTRPTAQQRLVVLVDGEVLAAGAQTWRYEAATNVVRFTGATCARLEQSTVVEPVSVEARLQG